MAKKSVFRWFFNKNDIRQKLSYESVAGKIDFVPCGPKTDAFIPLQKFNVKVNGKIAGKGLLDSDAAHVANGEIKLASAKAEYKKISHPVSKKK